jgi:hypothetical protein
VVGPFRYTQQCTNDNDDDDDNDNNNNNNNKAVKP